MGALEAPQDRHGQEHRAGTSRAEQTKEAMEAQEAMAVQGAQEAMEVQGLTGSLSNRFHFCDRGAGGWKRLPQTSLRGQDKTRLN